MTFSLFVHYLRGRRRRASNPPSRRETVPRSPRVFGALPSPSGGRGRASSPPSSAPPGAPSPPWRRREPRPRARAPRPLARVRAQRDDEHVRRAVRAHVPPVAHEAPPSLTAGASAAERRRQPVRVGNHGARRGALLREGAHRALQRAPRVYHVRNSERDVLLHVEGLHAVAREAARAAKAHAVVRPGVGASARRAPARRPSSRPDAKPRSRADVAWVDSKTADRRSLGRLSNLSPPCASRSPRARLPGTTTRFRASPQPPKPPPRRSAQPPTRNSRVSRRRRRRPQ